jgi:carboxymethylenebutenolidase
MTSDTGNAGFAKAVQPITPSAIHTDEIGLIAGTVEIPTSDRPIPGYTARSEGDGPFPVVLIVQEVFGVHEHIKDVCRRFAKRGYYAIAPELYFRQGDTSQMTSFDQIMPVVASVPDAQVLSDLDAATAWAARDGIGDISRLGISGFCWGGRITWLYCAHNPDVLAGVAWYGRLVGSPDPLHPQHPIDVVANLKSPVLGLYGASDPAIPMESVNQMQAALAAAGKSSTIVAYEGAGHAFYADYRPSYSAASAREAETRMFEWLAQNGVR